MWKWAENTDNPEPTMNNKSVPVAVQSSCWNEFLIISVLNSHSYPLPRGHVFTRVHFCVYCLVGLSAGLHTNYQKDFHKTQNRPPLTFGAEPDKIIYPGTFVSLSLTLRDRFSTFLWESWWKKSVVVRWLVIISEYNLMLILINVCMGSRFQLLYAIK